MVNDIIFNIPLYGVTLIGIAEFAFFGLFFGFDVSFGFGTLVPGITLFGLPGILVFPLFGDFVVIGRKKFNIHFL